MLSFATASVAHAGQAGTGSAMPSICDLGGPFSSEARDDLTWNLWRGSLAVPGVPLGSEWQGQFTPQANNVLVDDNLSYRLYWFSKQSDASPAVASTRSRVSRRRPCF
eukprot:gnl/MRDRNA2_/MRDRNA2_85542_c0_seq1.p1 gnl/MRDRNA2_/MRDRNA2_85542_c0~~gnl/MRDRNA2_/MRDRNA2_85542_c0_seq1.p1  ORF type:complete len:108 (-),score=16.07 gnl/MRDRNA2_/MRDRNA2_85542_c0_seq1:98-421(-)